MFYLVRNPETGGWIDTWFNASETDDPEKAAAKFGSLIAARSTARNLVRKHKDYNANYGGGPDGPLPVRYEIVAFRLVQDGVLFVAA